MRKSTTLLVSFFLILSLLLSACSKSNDGNNAEPTASATAGEDGANATAEPAASDGAGNADKPRELVELSWMIPTQQSAGLNESAAVKMLEEKFNVKFDIAELPSGEQFDEKKKLLIASQSIPDMMTWVTKDEGNQYGPAGAFLEITPLLDRMPNVKKYIEDNPDSKYNAYDQNNQLWRIPDVYPEVVPIFDASYVKSEFEAVGVPEPKTMDELYDAAVKLKAKYPDSYPFVGRGAEIGTSAVRWMFVQSFTAGKASEYGVVSFDPDADKWEYLAEVPGYKDAIAFMAKLYAEKLLDPEYITMDMNTMQDRIKNKKGFILNDYLGGLSGIADLNPGGVLYPLPIPTANGLPQVLGTKGAVLGDRGTILNSKLSGDKLDRALEVIDYMYSKEFYDFLYWNPEVTKEKGKSYIDDFYGGEKMTDLRNVYLPWSLNAGFVVDNETVTQAGTPYADYKLNVLRNPANADKYLPSPILPLTADQTKKINELKAAVGDYFNANIDQFITGKKKMDEWDAFIKALDSKGAGELAQIYNDSYQATK